ncbi:multidrug MFS transporter [Fictibacillus arsenicus]|uniref:Multidrug MFS transporter n=1 Tax=Fictibacillus arsenicus TaxID=255247 RepID=A0A1V3GDR4_9BACL|nr:sugar transferase [Fictibacillus arsenicus]OOE14996.1 multidrug MFS transporter [Fictibacillus arsenicus]
MHLHTGVTINTEQQRSYLLVKRIIDITGSLFGLFLLGILFLIVAIAIKIEDPKGPIIFTQKRVGKNGKEFKMYKFRSMISDAENRLEDLLKYNETTGAMFKMKDDPRVTRIGRFIRKTSIDELPQLWNVFLGDMSLVGPRPPLLREVEEYTEYDMQRLLVVPGCTGLWQVNGRSDIGFNEMVELDLQYIRSRNLKLDILIILKTIKVMILPDKGAY